jgi:hypothetical protein
MIDLQGWQNLNMCRASFGSRRDYTMHANETPASSETPPPAEQPASLPPPSKRSRKKIYAVLGIVAVVTVASALVFAFLVPQSSGTIIPLSYNFTVGDTMTYNVTANETTMGRNSVSIMTLNMDIVSFDGENYTINETFSVSLLGPQSYSLTEKMNKTGYFTITYISGLPAGMNQTNSAGNGPLGFGTFFLKGQARVGETWQVPMGLSNLANIGPPGNLTYKFGDIQNITVPAGTYKVFRIDVSGSNLTMSSTMAGVSFSMNMSLSGQEYLEYGTCRPIDFNLQESASSQSGGQNSTMTSYIQMILAQDSRH